jgi:hypothetical protein
MRARFGWDKPIATRHLPWLFFQTEFWMDTLARVPFASALLIRLALYILNVMLPVVYAGWGTHLFLILIHLLPAHK